MSVSWRGRGREMEGERRKEEEGKRKEEEEEEEEGRKEGRRIYFYISVGRTGLPLIYYSTLTTTKKSTDRDFQ